jgi:hypothetical protein
MADAISIHSVDFEVCFPWDRPLVSHVALRQEHRAWDLRVTDLAERPLQIIPGLQSSALGRL